MIDNEDWEDIEEIVDEEVFDYDTEEDVTENVITISRRIIYRLVGIGIVLLTSITFYILGALNFIEYIYNPTYIETYYLLTLDSPELAYNITNESSVYFKYNFNTIQIYVTKDRNVFPPKSYEEFDNKMKVYNEKHNKVRVSYLSYNQIILKVLEKKDYKGKFEERVITLNEIYVGEGVKYYKADYSTIRKRFDL